MPDLALAKALEPVLSDPALIDEMVRLSHQGRPAVEAIGKQVAALRPDIDDAGKQQVGRLVRDRLAARGLKPVRSARVRPGNLFAWGAVYGSRFADRPDGFRRPTEAEIDAWLADARAIVAKLPGLRFGSDGLIADRRAEAAAEALKGY